MACFFLTAFTALGNLPPHNISLPNTHTAKKGEGMRYFRAMVALVLLMMVAINASAQTTTGSMLGTVVDAQDQVVPGADVILTSEQTQEVRRTVTNEVGLFTFPALQPGPYTVRVELTGFRPFERRSNMVVSNNRLQLPPVKLEVGTLAEAVTVSAIGEVVAMSQTSQMALLDLKQVENLSIRGRDPISFLKILPGVGLLANDQETFGGSFSTPVPNIQGGTGQTIYVDGINGGDGGGGGSFSNATNVDAIAEINVQMSNYTAEYGLKGGAQVNIITKRGGAEYHGTGYWYKRHEMWNATNFFNNRDGHSKAVLPVFDVGRHAGRPDSEDRPEQALLLLFGGRHAVERREHLAALHDADGSRAERRFLADAAAERHAHPDHRSDDGCASSRTTSFLRTESIPVARRC